MADKVIVGITTYNLERYVAQALDSVLMQKTTFPFSILVVDDCSADGTRGILEEYRQRDPDRIKVIALDRNGGSLHASNILFDNIKSEYFAFLDGDDYWLTQNRLQRQVDFLDSHPEYAMCGGNTRYLNVDAPEVTLSGKVVDPTAAGKSYSYSDYVESRAPFVHTSAILLRNTVYRDGIPEDYVRNESTVFNCAYRGEDVRFVAHLKTGPIFVMDEDLSVYRIHRQGIWQGKSRLRRNLEAALSQYSFSRQFGGGRLEEPVYRRSFAESYRVIMDCLAECFELGEKECVLLQGLLGEMVHDDIDWSFLKKPQGPACGGRRLRRLVKAAMPYGLVRLLQKRREYK